MAKFSTMVYDLTVNELFDENSRRTRVRRSPWTVLDEYAAVLKVAADGFVKHRANRGWTGEEAQTGTPSWSWAKLLEH